MKLSISEIAERHLESWLDQAMRGELQLWQLPAPVAAWYFAGWADRDHHAQAQARDYEHRLDVLYMQAFTPKERHAEFSRRLEEHFQREEAAFFAADVEHENETGLHTDQSRVLSRAAAA